jgi:hypothetical protein
MADMSRPTELAITATCAAVTYDMAGPGLGDPPYDAGVGDLLWNPKAGAGHVLVAEVECGTEHNGRRVDCGCGGWGKQPCGSWVLVCECGEDDSFRDHHYEILSLESMRP